MIVRSTADMRKSDAERALMCPDFDICWRYSDILNNFAVCLALLFFSSPNSYRIMGWLVVFFAMIFAIDHYKLLRQTSQTFYTTDTLSVTFSYLLCLPTG